MRFLIFAISFACLSCAHPISKFYPEIVPAKSEAELPLSDKPDHTLNLVYLGCGNMVLEQNGEAIITDPFFSNQKFLKLAGRIRTKPGMYNTWKTNYQYFLSPAVVRAGLVSHTHYDHVMDLPVLLQDRYFTNLSQVYGNPYLPKMLTHFKDEGTNLNALSHDQVYNPVVNRDQEYKWISVTPRIRFLPILSNHAPHMGSKLYMDDPLKEIYFKEHLIYSNSKVKAFKWTTGETYSFLVDFIENDTLRVFIQTSASQHPFGFPPEEVLRQKSVDVAVLCYASGLNVDDYPGAIVNYLNPKKLIFVHWEDFFRAPKSFHDQKLVRGTNPKKMRKRIDKLDKPARYFMMPKPGTQIKIRY